MIKSIFGFFEILAGIVFAISGRLIVNNLIIALTQQEISEDPNDFFANFLVKAANSFSAGSHIFAVVYLIFHGLINIFLAVALLKNKIWAYPWAMTGFSIFIIYQIFRYFHTHSLLLLFLTIFDIFIVLIIFLEYNSKKRIKRMKMFLEILLIIIAVVILIYLFFYFAEIFFSPVTSKTRRTVCFGAIVFKLNWQKQKPKETRVNVQNRIG